MNGFIFTSLLFVASVSLASVDNFSALIAQGYGDQSKTYAQVQSEVDSASQQGEVLEDLSKPSEAKEVQLQLIKDQKRMAADESVRAERKERPSAQENVR